MPGLDIVGKQMTHVDRECVADMFSINALCWQLFSMDTFSCCVKNEPDLAGLHSPLIEFR